MPNETNKLFDPIAETIKILDEYQREYLKLLFQHQLVITTKARQIGVSFTTALWCVLSRLETPNSKVLIMSRDAQAAKGFLQFCKQWANALNILFNEIIVDPEDSTQISLNFKNGSQIIARSSNPNAPRSFSGSIVLDEFSFMDQQEEMFRAALSVTDQGHSFIIISTFNGIGNTYYDLVEKTKRGETEFKLFDCDIVKAVNQGLANRRGKPTDPWRLVPPGEERNKIYLDYLKRRCVNEAGWKQEYLCLPISTESLISEQLFDRQAVFNTVNTLFDHKWGDLYVGIDIGRSHDPSTIVVLEHKIDPDPTVEDSLKDVYITVYVKSLYDTPYDVQIQLFKTILNHPNVVRAQIDNNGLGGPIFEFLQNTFPGITYPTSFHIDQKMLMYEKLVGFLETDRLGLAKDQPPDYKNQFMAMRRVPSKTGKTTYDGRTKGSHCDTVVATAMALFGATEDITGPIHMSNFNER
jgi:phage FluMu gp28-like protein